MTDDALRLCWLITQHDTGGLASCDDHYCELTSWNGQVPEELRLARRILARFLFPEPEGGFAIPPSLFANAEAGGYVVVHDPYSAAGLRLVRTQTTP